MKSRSAAAGLLDSPDDHVRGFRRVAEAPYHRGNLAAVVRLVIHDVPDDHPEWGRLLLAFQVLPDERAREAFGRMRGEERPVLPRAARRTRAASSRPGSSSIV